jgi:GT2 family glycosyltransferase
MHVYLHLLTWNSERFLPDLFESIEEQTYTNYTLRIFDNGSTDGTLDYLSQYQSTHIIGRSPRNIGFAAGHNKILEFTWAKMSDSEREDSLIVFVNADIILDKNFLKEIVEAAEQTPDGIIQPKLYRAFFSDQYDYESTDDTVLSDIIDSTGLTMRRGYRFTDRGAGELDEGQFDDIGSPFGACGALFGVKTKALQELVLAEEFFDADFFSYREDCDLALRAAVLGVQTTFAKGAKAYHHRGLYMPEKSTIFEKRRASKKRNKFFVAIAQRNQLFLYIKNVPLSEIIRELPWIVAQDGMRWIYGVLFIHEMRKQFIVFLRQFSKMRVKRRELFARKNSYEV